MLFQPALCETRFLRRYKRFFVDVEALDGVGEALTVHCPNTGSMKGCLTSGARAWISDSGNPARQLRYTLEMLEADGARVLVNTQRPNRLVEEAILNGTLVELQGYDAVDREVAYGLERPPAGRQAGGGVQSRVDLRLRAGTRQVYVEVKNATLGVGAGRTLFPDAVTARGARHLRELAAVVAEGHRGVLVFCAGRDDTRVVAPADDIDPKYGAGLRAAAAAGVEVLAYRCRLEAGRALLVERVPVDLGG